MGIPARRPQLDALTSVRFFAALHVVLYHGQPYLRPLLDGHPWLRNVVGAGPTSVSLFFVLSGFILAYTYLGPPEEGRLRRLSFWAARFARVYPVYLFGLLVATPVSVRQFVWDGATPGRYLAVAATVLPLVQSWTPQFALAWNAPSWSLSAEAFFYVVFPFAAPALWPLRRRGLLVSLLIFWGLAQLAPALYALAPAGGWLGGGNASPDFWTAVMDNLPYGHWERPWYAAIQYNPLARLPEFLFGVALGRLYLLNPAPRRPENWSLAAAGAVAALLVALAAAPDRVRQSLFFHNGLLTPLFGLLIYALACGRAGGLSRWLSRRPLVILGEASYALYILHLPLKNILHLLAERWSRGSVPALPFFAAYAVLAVLASLATWRWVEEPARRFLRRRLSRWAEAA